MIFYGASGHAKVVVEAWLASGGKVSGIIDDNDKILRLFDFDVVRKIDQLSESDYIVSVGANDVRKKIVTRLNVSFGKVIHPNSQISLSAGILDGSVIMAGSVINAEVKIGKHAIINTCSSIDHECNIGDFAHIAPGATLCGNVEVGEGALIGAGAVVIPELKIGKWAIVGAGAVVINDVPDYHIVVGNPARDIGNKKPS